MPSSLLYVLLMSSLLGSGVAWGAGLAEVNQVRRSAGMQPLQWQSALADAAAAHAAYLSRNKAPGSTFSGGSAHTEIPGEVAFSGVSPGDRAVAKAYPHRQVLENISSGEGGYAAAVDGLMSAIYHRFAFLDFTIDEGGSAAEVHAGGKHFVFLMGRKDLREHCESPPPEALASPPVSCGGTRVSEAFFDRLCRRMPGEALFRQPWPTVCGNGRKLDAAYMERLCRSGFPRGARLLGAGRYYELCRPAIRIRAQWFDKFCASPPKVAEYRGSGRYYEVCEPPKKVEAAWLERRCKQEPYRDSGQYQLPCADSSIKLRAETISALDQTLRRSNPDIVLWPPNNAAGVLPAFFEEDPDPLPDLSVSGYPVSLQFNPATTDSVSLSSFELYRWYSDRAGSDSNWRKVRRTRLIDERSDPQYRMTAMQFTLFPLQRLAWAARYRAQAVVSLNGKRRKLVWEFTTKDPGRPLINFDDEAPVYWIGRGDRPVIYLPPRGDAVTIGGLTVKYRGNTRVTMTAVDGNTARLDIEWDGCAPIRIEDGRGRSAKVERYDCS